MFARELAGEMTPEVTGESNLMGLLVGFLSLVEAVGVLLPWPEVVDTMVEWAREESQESCLELTGSALSSVPLLLDRREERRKETLDSNSV